MIIAWTVVPSDLAGRCSDSSEGGSPAGMSNGLPLRRGRDELRTPRRGRADRPERQPVSTQASRSPQHPDSAGAWMMTTFSPCGVAGSAFPARIHIRSFPSPDDTGLPHDVVRRPFAFAGRERRCATRRSRAHRGRTVLEHDHAAFAAIPAWRFGEARVLPWSPPCAHGRCTGCLSFLLEERPAGRPRRFRLLPTPTMLDTPTCCAAEAQDRHADGPLCRRQRHASLDVVRRANSLTGSPACSSSRRCSAEDHGRRGCVRSRLPVPQLPSHPSSATPAGSDRALASPFRRLLQASPRRPRGWRTRQRPGRPARR